MVDNIIKPDRIIVFIVLILVADTYYSIVHYKLKVP